MAKSLDVLLCYRGRFQAFVRALAGALRRSGVRAAFDREILADPHPAFDPEREVEWARIGVQPDDDTAWRAPLRAAVDAAEMVVFAIAYPDLSENVINEMQWSIRSQAHTFLLVHDAPTALEAQGVIISTLAIQYLLVTGGPEYPEFGYHFCGSLEGVDLDREATIAAHRIVEHRARCRAGALRTMNAADGLTLAALEQRPEARARRFLRGLQASLHRGDGAALASDPSPAMQAAREHLARREAEFTGTRAPAGRVEQFRRAEDILARCRPGPHESASYFGTLMLEAAALEMVMHADLRVAQPQTLDFMPMVVVGTVQGSNLLLPWASIERGDFRVLILDAAFLDFLYQLLKLMVVATAVPATDGVGHQGLMLDFEHLPEALASNGGLLDAFYGCVRRYACAGKPQTSVDAPKDAERIQALSTWIRLTERGLLALGYADFTLRGAPWPPPADTGSDAKTAAPADAGSRRDRLALDYGVRAGKLADDAGPVQALAAVLAVHCAIHIRQRMLATLNPASAKWNVDAGGSFEARLRELLVPVDEKMTLAGAPQAWRKSALEQAWLGGTALLQFWSRVEPRLRAEAAAGLAPYTGWG